MRCGASRRGRNEALVMVCTLRCASCGQHTFVLEHDAGCKFGARGSLQIVADTPQPVASAWLSAVTQNTAACGGVHLPCCQLTGVHACAVEKGCLRAIQLYLDVCCSETVLLVVVLWGGAPLTD